MNSANDNPRPLTFGEKVKAAFAIGLIVVIVGMVIEYGFDRVVNADQHAAAREQAAIERQREVERRESATEARMARFCAVFDDAPAFIGGMIQDGFVVNTDQNRLIVHQTAWFSLPRDQRLTLLMAYSCASGDDTVRAVSNRDGRRLGICVRGNCSETAR